MRRAARSIAPSSPWKAGRCSSVRTRGALCIDGAPGFHATGRAAEGLDLMGGIAQEVRRAPADPHLRAAALGTVQQIVRAIPISYLDHFSYRQRPGAIIAARHRSGDNIRHRAHSFARKAPDQVGKLCPVACKGFCEGRPAPVLLAHPALAQPCRPAVFAPGGAII